MEKELIYNSRKLENSKIWLLFLFTLNKKIKEHNKKIALQCGFEVTDLLKHGLV